MTSGRACILFTGYAPVHYVCFRPIHERLIARGDVDVFVSGGLRHESDEGTEHDARALYEGFGIASDRILGVEEIQDRSFDLLFAANTQVIRPRRAGAVVQLFHGVSFRNRAIRPDGLSCDGFFLIGPYMQRRFDELGLLARDDRRGIPIGFPKTDPVVRGDLDRAVAGRRFGLSGERPVVVYAPTGAKHNSLDNMGREVIERRDRSGRFDVLVKLHDHPKRGLADYTRLVQSLEGERVKVARDPDVIPALAASDLLLSDASSVSNEYTLLDRPIVYLDVPRLLDRAREAKDSALDLETWGRRGGVVVTRPEEVVGAVEQSLAEPDRHGAVRRQIAADLFFNPGRATDAAAAWIGEFLGSPVAGTR